ncbi:MAG: hypothetical protein PW734_07660 [Verrucomicrobium sp.]|nr:hypothetical protein [Verrucomicrobium sp.]
MQEELPYSLISKFIRHLGDSGHVQIGVTHHDITTASLIFHEMGIETEVNHFFHQNMAQPPDMKGEKNGNGQLPSRIWTE